MHSISGKEKKDKKFKNLAKLSACSSEDAMEFSLVKIFRNRLDKHGVSTNSTCLEESKR